MKKLLVIAGGVLLGTGIARSQDMTLGGTGAAIGGGATLDGGGNAGFGRAVGNARNTPGSPPGGDMGEDGGGSGMSPGSSRTGAAAGFAGGGGMGGQSATPAAPKQNPLLYGNETGETLLGELLRGGARTAPRTRKASLRYSRNKPLAKYNLPARGYLAYYLPADRYKVASSDWRFVAIEDDAARYPARYYYPPSASNFLQLIAQPALGARIRGNRSARVIGFHTWQDAMLAGYRPDPVSKPAPGAQFARLAASGRTSQLARYLGFVYAGQIPVSSFESTYNYALTVQRIANSRRDTRRYAGQAVGQALVAALGEGPRPIAVGPYGITLAQPPKPANDTGVGGRSSSGSSSSGSSSMTQQTMMGQNGRRSL